jgi:hypothetical protein
MESFITISCDATIILKFFKAYLLFVLKEWYVTVLEAKRSMPRCQVHSLTDRQTTLHGVSQHGTEPAALLPGK